VAFARLQALGSPYQQEAAATAHVEHLLVASPGDAIEQRLALTHLAHLARPDHPEAGQGETDSDPVSSDWDSRSIP